MVQAPVVRWGLSPSPLPPGVGVEPWEPTVTEYREDAVLILDTSHQPPGSLRGSLAQMHRGLTVYLGNHVKIAVKKGDPSRRTRRN